jgi:high-affinity iron transporter
VAEAIVWVAYVAVVLPLFLRPQRTHAATPTT